jgi:hypothetical protein
LLELSGPSPQDYWAKRGGEVGKRVLVEVEVWVTSAVADPKDRQFISGVPHKLDSLPHKLVSPHHSAIQTSSPLGYDPMQRNIRPSIVVVPNQDKKCPNIPSDYCERG